MKNGIMVLFSLGILMAGLPLKASDHFIQKSEISAVNLPAGSYTAGPLDIRFLSEPHSYVYMKDLKMYNSRTNPNGTSDRVVNVEGDHAGFVDFYHTTAYSLTTSYLYPEMDPTVDVIEFDMSYKLGEGGPTIDDEQYVVIRFTDFVRNSIRQEVKLYPDQFTHVKIQVPYGYYIYNLYFEQIDNK